MKTSRKYRQQFAFFDSTFQISKEFGGSLHGKGNAKKSRPLSTKHAMHLVLRSSVARGDWSMRSAKNLRMVEQTVRKLAKQFGITIYKFANVGNHLHLLIKLSNRFTFAPFIRALTGSIAMQVTGAKKLSAMKLVLAARTYKCLNAKGVFSKNARAIAASDSTVETQDDTANSEERSQDLAANDPTMMTQETPADTAEKFWDFRPWSRIVEWGKAYSHAKAYVFQNEQEAAGEVPYKPRVKRSG